MKKYITIDFKKQEIHLPQWPNLDAWLTRYEKTLLLISIILASLVWSVIAVVV